MPTDLAHAPAEFQIATRVPPPNALKLPAFSNRLSQRNFYEIEAGFRDRRISATVVVPRLPSSLASRPIMALHGVSRDNEEMLRLCAPFADATGRVLIVPHFDRSSWPVFQRFQKNARPDYALLGLVDAVHRRFAIAPGPVDLFGYSGGAQLAHRFTMLYPHKVGDLHLGAAGWYTMPSADVPYPYGLGVSEAGQKCWGRRMQRTMAQYLDRKITVYAGDRDTVRDRAMRKNAILEQHEGSNRFVRAKRYVAALNSEADRLGMARPATFVSLNDCGHSVSECAGVGMLDHVFGCTRMIGNRKAGLS